MIILRQSSCMTQNEISCPHDILLCERILWILYSFVKYCFGAHTTSWGFFLGGGLNNKKNFASKDIINY